MKIISVQELRYLAGSLGFRQVDYLDASYACPALGWLTEFGTYLAARRKPYMAEKYDCENFARWATAKADEALYASAVDDSGHTFGEACCLIPSDDPSGPPFTSHALNLCLCDDGVWYVFEPQTSKITPEKEAGISWTTLRI